MNILNKKVDKRNDFKNMNHFNITKTGNVFGILSIILFFVCMAWGVLLSEPSLQELHLNLIKVAYPGFAMSLGGAIIGIIEAFVYGWIFGVVFAWLCKKVCVFEEKRNS